MTSLEPAAKPPAPPEGGRPARAPSRPRRRRRLSRGLPVLSSVGGVVLWQLIGQFAVENSLFLATPLQALRALWELAVSGELWTDMWVSGIEFFGGYVLAGAVGILVGLLMASSRTVSGILSPWVSGFYATPIIALAPLLILWFGIGPASKIAVVFSLVVFPVIINTEAGVRATDRDIIEAARAFGATGPQLFTKISAPSALPHILTGLRLGVARGLIGVVVGELFGANEGLGHLILNAAQVFNMPRLFAGLIVLALVGIALNEAFLVAERRIVHWQNIDDTL